MIILLHKGGRGGGIKNQKLYLRLLKKNIFFLLLTRWSGAAI